jgi:hypothetical protein
VELTVFGGTLHITRIEVWNNSKLVGTAGPEQISFGGRHSFFHVPVSDLAPGSQVLLLRAYLQNGLLAATASFPVSVFQQELDYSTDLAYRGSIDYPADNSLANLPLSLRGWAAIVGNGRNLGEWAVEVWDGPRESGSLLTDAVHGTYRPDVGEALGGPYFATSGWIAQLSDLPVGPLDLYLYIRNRETGAYAPTYQEETTPTRRVTLVEGKIADAPWPVALAAAPDGRLFFAELLTGQIRIWHEGQIATEAFAVLDNVSTHGESGLLGLALHPNFAEEPFVYAMYVVDNPETGMPLMQRVVRFREENGVGKDFTVVIDNLPATKTARHNGGRIEFGHDGMLYVVVADIDISEASQDLSSLAGSILRYDPDGGIPSDNPLPGSPIYAYGQRSPFGLAFQPETGSLYATENGPGGFDEINRIEAGGNYGWPLHMGVADAEGFIDPIAVFGLWPDIPTYGPTGATFPLDRPDLLLFCGYHAPGLHALQLGGPEYKTVERQMLLSKNCILDVTASSDGWLYYSSISAIYRARLEDLLRMSEQQLQ